MLTIQIPQPLETQLTQLATQQNLPLETFILQTLQQLTEPEQKTFWQIINIAVPIIIVLLFAIVFQWLRKRKYTK